MIPSNPLDLRAPDRIDEMLALLRDIRDLLKPKEPIKRGPGRPRKQP